MKPPLTLEASNAVIPSMTLYCQKYISTLRNRSSLRCTVHSSVQTPLFIILSANLGVNLHGLSLRKGWTQLQYCTQQPWRFLASAAYPQRHPPCRQGLRYPCSPPDPHPLWAGRHDQACPTAQTGASEPGIQRFPPDIDCAYDWLSPCHVLADNCCLWDSW